MHFRFTRLAALVTVLVLLPALAGASTLVTSFYPVWVMTLNLTQGMDDITVRNLTEPATGCLHDYALQSSDLVSLSDADALLINGAGMEAFLPEITAAFPALPILDASRDIPLMAEGEVPEIGESETEGGNPHLWMDPARAAKMAQNLAEGLEALFPDRAEAFRANLQDYLSRLEALDSELKESFSVLNFRDVIPFDDALPYLAEACGLHAVLIVHKEPDEQISTAQMASLIRTVSALEPRPLLLCSSPEDPAVQLLARETGAEICVLDPFVSGQSGATPDVDAYEQAQRKNLSALLEAFVRAENTVQP